MLHAQRSGRFTLVKMVFSDLFFLFVFLPAFILCYLGAGFLDRGKLLWRNSVLVVFSIIFYAWGEPVYVFLMLLCVLLNWLAGLAIAKAERHRKCALAIGVAVNILILGTFKYAGFFATQLCQLGLEMPVPQIALPIGISFYTFQSISYLVDVYRREARVQHNLWNLLLYISMFPQLIAGPIVRYGTIAEEIHERKASAADISDGVFRFLIGLGKKVIIANQMGEVADQLLKNGLQDLTVAGAWVGILAFTLQIYFDFSGYSDMAIGMGRCMGFHFNENFNHPYISRSITEFWRRWHISLGSFFRDYLYIPLGGNRRHQSLNILVVWLLTGLWHGASWNFVLWGVYFGVIVTLEKYTLLKVQARIPSVLLHLYSILLFVVGWGIFYFDDFEAMRHFFHAFTGGAEVWTDITVESALLGRFWLWLLAVVLCVPVRTWVTQWYERHVPASAVKSLVAVSAKTLLSIVVLVLSTALLVGATNNAFIYTRF